MNRMDKDLDNIISRYVSENSPGVSLLIGRNNKIVYTGNVGFSNLEKNILINDDTNFLIASLTKQFTCTCIMILKERGLIDYNQNLLDFFPSFPSYLTEVNIEHLMTHTSGIKDYLDDSFFKNITNRVITKEGIIERIIQYDALKFEPGTEFSYSNSGYVLLGDIIEKISNKSYGEFLKENVFDILNIRNSFILEDIRSTDINKISTGYRNTDANSFEKIDFTADVVGWSDGNMISNIKDLFNWNNSLFSGRILKKSTIKEAHTPYKFNNGEISNYGYGWFIETEGELTKLWHTGTTLGYVSKMMKIVEKDIVIIMLSNYMGIKRDEMFSEIYNVVLNHK